MKKILLLIIITLFYSCNNSKKEATAINLKTKIEKKLFSNTESQIKKYGEDSQKYWDIGDNKNALKYDDSIKNTILNSYIGDHTFISVDNIAYRTTKRKKPLFLQVTASWCPPCKFEIPMLNKIVEKYSDQVDFVLLFQDAQAKVEKISLEYHKDIVLVPSIKEQSEGINISGFRHVMGFPTDYLITKNNEIINFYQGASKPGTFKNLEGNDIIITKEQANKTNYQKLEKEVTELIKGQISNTID